MSESSRPLPSARTFFDEVGGHDTFVRLVGTFYAGVRTDPVLAPLYPQDDWEGAETRLRGFLEQYWGGPRTYSEERGHPRLRMRHAPFAIGPAERDAWLSRMRVAVSGLYGVQAIGAFGAGLGAERASAGAVVAVCGALGLLLVAPVLVAFRRTQGHMADAAAPEGPSTA